MKFYFLRETADANIKACGAWIHCRTTLIGVAPAWWFRDRSTKRPIRRLGLNILTPARHYDRFIFISVEIGRKRFGIYRTTIGGAVHLGSPGM